MPRPNDLSRSLVALDQNSTIIAVVEMSQSSWLIGGLVPGIERQQAIYPLPGAIEVVAQRAVVEPISWMHSLSESAASLGKLSVP
jgi:hypothetical protein